jgi:hypothetical protein
LALIAFTKRSIESLGTSANLNRLYYTTLANTPGASGEAVKAVAGPFDPNNYDDNPGETKDYSGSTYLESRRDHLPGRNVEDGRNPAGVDRLFPQAQRPGLDQTLKTA